MLEIDVTVEAEITEVQHEVGSRGRHVVDDSVPVGLGLRGGGREMGVRDDAHPHRVHASTLPGGGRLVGCLQSNSVVRRIGTPPAIERDELVECIVAQLVGAGRSERVRL